MERLVSVTEKEASALMVILAESPTILERMGKIGYPVTEKELNDMKEKFRTLCWDFHHAKRLSCSNAGITGSDGASAGS